MPIDTFWNRVGYQVDCTVVTTPHIALDLDHARTLSTVPSLENRRALTGDPKETARLDVSDVATCGYSGPSSLTRN